MKIIASKELENRFKQDLLSNIPKEVINNIANTINKYYN